MASPIPSSAVSEKVRKHVDPRAPAPLRMMAARGMVPMGPSDMVTVLSSLYHDEDEKVRQAAQKSLAELPDRIVQGALKEALHPLTLDHLARTFEKNESHLETILINQETPDETFAFLGDRVGERLLGIIVENQVRMLRHKSIVKKMLANPGILKSQVDRVMDFAVRTEMKFDGMAEFEEAKQRVAGVPMDIEEEKRLNKVIVDSLPEDFLSEDDFDEDQECDPEEMERKSKTLLQRMSEMTVGQKIALAQKGNKTIRVHLIKDSNKMVATAAIKNPGINEGEIVAVASNRSVCDDVIRIIAQSREWTRNYQVKLALMNNPKTPLGLAIRYLTSIRVSDLKTLSSNKNIPATLATSAKKLLQKRQGKG